MKNVIIFVSLISAVIICFVLMTSYAKEQDLDLRYEKADSYSHESQEFEFKLYTVTENTKNFWKEVAKLNKSKAETIIVTDEEGNTVTDKKGKPVTEVVTTTSEEENTGSVTEIPSDNFSENEIITVP